MKDDGHRPDLVAFGTKKKTHRTLLTYSKREKLSWNESGFFFFIIKNKRERERKKRKSGKSPGKNKGAAERKMPKNHSVQSLKLVETKNGLKWNFDFFFTEFLALLEMRSTQFDGDRNRVSQQWMSVR